MTTQDARLYGLCLALLAVYPALFTVIGCVLGCQLTLRFGKLLWNVAMESLC